MGGQEECSEFDASIRTRILTPSSESLPSSHGPFKGKSKKRKREEVAMEDLLDESFNVKPHPSTVFSKPHALSPIALIPRTHVPLSFLDILSPSGPLPVSRLFEAHVKVLELEERMGSTPTVLIAHCGHGKSTFVVERVEYNLYVICKLGSWVSLGQLCSGAIISRHQPARVASKFEPGSVLYEDKDELQVTPESSKYNKKKRLAIEAIQSMVKRPSRDSLSTVQVEEVPCSQTGIVLVSQSSRELEPEVIQDDINKRPMATDIFDNIRSQYFEALYLSKASLAYFAKGPLSRARAAFHLDYDSTLDMNELVEFLESLILPTTLVDKKYKDGVPAFLSSLMPDGSKEDGSKTPQKVKKFKSKKSKPGKNGIYPAEDAYLSQWWGFYEIEAEKGALEGSREDIMKKRVAQLRIREMQLQMIVILETLALQSLATSPTDQSGELPSISQLDGRLGDKTAIRSKSKKPLDLAMLIEVNIDRLCIWQSLAAEDGRTASMLGGASNVGPKSSGMASTYDHAADILREFCIEVIVPFFSARLPEQCGAIRRKLGGSVIVSPARPKLVSSTTLPAASSRPGGVTKRPVPSKPRRSLRRVITDERHARDGSRGASVPFSLMRSATTPSIPGLKRERSKTPLLSNIPSVETQSMLVSRGSVLKSKNFSQREVDLSSAVAVNDTKSKKASIEAELKDAISALKKPNRQLAGQLQVETERRTASAPTHSRKSKKPTRNPSFPGVQILSTPKGKRRRDLGVENHPFFGLDPGQSHELDVMPPSGIPRVPLSVACTQSTQRSEETLLCEATPARPGTKITQAILGTSHTQTKSPPLSSSVLVGAGLESHDGLPPSPLQARRPGKQELLEIPALFSQAIEHTPSKVVAVHATPIKQGKLNFIEADTYPNPPNVIVKGADIDETENIGKSDGQGDGVDDSIYKSLGWDDYDEFS